MKNFDAKAEVIIGLQNKGYNLDFMLSNEFLRCIQDGELISPDDFEITETFLFTGETQAEIPSVIYAISSWHYNIKGILMTSFNAFTQGLSIHLWSKLAANLN